MNKLKIYSIAALGVVALLTFSCKKKEPEVIPSTADWFMAGHTGVGEFEGFKIIDMAVDQAGNTYVTGTYDSKLTIDERANTYFLEPDGNSSTYLFKLNQDGRAIWARSISTSAEMEVKDLELAPNGDVILAGFAVGQLALNVNTSGFSQVANGDIVISFSPDGAVNWGTSDVATRGINHAVAASNDYAIVFESSEFYTSGEVVWYNHFGSVVKTLSFENPWAPDPSVTVATNRNNEVLIAGNYGDTIGFSGPGFESISFTRIMNEDDYQTYVFKLDANGNVLFKGAVTEEVQQAILLDNGDFLLAGVHVGAVDVDPTNGVTDLPKHSANYEYWFTYLYADGSFGWTTAINGGRLEIGRLTYHNGDFYIGGTTSLSVNVISPTQSGVTVVDNPDEINYGFLLQINQQNGAVSGLHNREGYVFPVGIGFNPSNHMIIGGTIRDTLANFAFGANYHSDTLQVWNPFFVMQDENPF